MSYDIDDIKDIAEKMRSRAAWPRTDAIVSTLLINGSREIETLRAQVARQRAWIDGVMAQYVEAMVLPDRVGVTLAWAKPPSCKRPPHGTEFITRPAPFEDK